MRDILLYLLTLAYGGVSVLTLVAYYPTVRDLAHHKKPSANTSTYVLWSVTSAIGLLYAIFILYDKLFLVVALTNFLANMFVLVLRLRLPN